MLDGSGENLAFDVDLILIEIGDAVVSLTDILTFVFGHDIHCGDEP